MTPTNRQKILVVDDEPDAVEFVKTVMEEAGYEVAAAHDGNEGLRKAAADRPDLVILDVQMPGKDGFGVFVQMRKTPELKTIPVVMLTGVGGRTGVHFSARDMGDYLGEEPDAYVEKPVDPKTLLDTVEALLKE